MLSPYRADSPYAAVLHDCAILESAADACTLETLPFITQATPDFTREDILDRLLVTHDWMGERFEQLLAAAPEQMISLFGSLTSITIGSTVRPSNYWIVTGGIQLDPDYLWLSVSEKANISIDEDYRSDFGRELQFWNFGVHRIGNQAAESFYSLTSETERTLEDIKIPVYRLLYHELAHAVDYLPPASVPTLDISLSPLNALDDNRQYFLSPRLYDDQPLYSQLLYDLAQVRYRGEEAVESQTLLSPTDVGNNMAIDGAMKFYGYSSIREDFATLFAMAMMKQDFNVDYYVAFVNKPEDENDWVCADIKVGWGVKNRLADPLVSPRAKWSVESVYGSSASIDDFFTNDIGIPVPMTAGVDWCTNRDGASIETAPEIETRSRASIAAALEAQRIQLEGERFRY